MPKRGSKGSPTGVKGLHDGRGKGKGRAPGKGVGKRKVGKKGPCKQSSAHCEVSTLPVHNKGMKADGGTLGALVTPAANP